MERTLPKVSAYEVNKNKILFSTIIFPAFELYRRKKVIIKRNSGASASFMITPSKLGHIEIKVSAGISGVLEDTAIKNLLVTVSM